MRFEVYRNTISSDEEFQITNRIHQSMMSEDNDVCIQAQQGLHLGLPGDEQLLSFQTIVRDLVTAHHRLEQETGEELWPARQRIPTEDSVSQEDMDFCSKLTSKDGSGLSSGGCCGGGCGGGPPMKPATAPETMVS